jgi:hypothetical protein
LVAAKKPEASSPPSGPTAFAMPESSVNSIIYKWLAMNTFPLAFLTDLEATC